MRKVYDEGGVELWHGDVLAGSTVEFRPDVFDAWLTDAPNETAGESWWPHRRGMPLTVLVNMEIVGAWMSPGPVDELKALRLWRRPTRTIAGDVFDALLSFGRDLRDAPGVIEDSTAIRSTEHPAERGLDNWQAVLAAMDVESVFDPFVGSGTTLVAARRLGIRAVGVEIDEHWVDVALRRLTLEAAP